MNKKLIIDGNAVYEIDLDCIECFESESQEEERMTAEEQGR